MADKFRVGQKVRIIKSDKSYRIGVIATITSQRRHFPNLAFGMNAFTYDLDLAPVESFVVAVSYPEECLEAVDDGSEKSSWSECLWKPKPIVHSIEDEITTDTGGE